MMQIRLLYTLLVVTIFFGACSRENPADPSCRINSSYPSNEAAPAACLIKLDGKLVAIQTNQNNYWLYGVEKKFITRGINSIYR